MGTEASVVVAAIENVWHTIGERHPDVPSVVVTLGAGSIGTARGYLRLGHFAARRWETGADQAAAELFVGGEGLARGAASVLATLLHEASHGIAYTRNLKDTSRQGRYHNQVFKTIAEEVGLTVQQARVIGWSQTALTPETETDYAAELDTLQAAITVWRHAESDTAAGSGGSGPTGPDGDGKTPTTTTTKPKNGVVLVCACETPRRVRVAASTADLGPIFCGLCGIQFLPQDS